MSAATVRHHLAILSADGRIVSEGTEHRPRRGRPQKAYRLSDRLLGDNLANLAAAALDGWLESLPQSKRESAVSALADRLRMQAVDIDPRLPASRRIVQLIEKLDAMHYEARWEAGAAGPRVLFGHCPYASIIEKHPELCRVDALILSAAMNSDVEQLARIGRGPGDAVQCVFALRNPKRIAE